MQWWSAKEPIETEMLSGCCLFMRRAVVEELGYVMDPRYPLYFEDTDLFRTLRKMGYKVVHHGGAGTTAGGLRAGLPTLVCPLSVDQPFWAKRVFALGCGPQPQSLKRLKADELAAGLRELVGDPGYRKRAEEVGAKIRAENGVARAIEVIESLRREPRA